MRTRAYFCCDLFAEASPGDEAEQSSPTRRLAAFLASGLPARGFAVRGIESDDWGHRVELMNPDFELWLACSEDGPNSYFRVSIHPGDAQVHPALRSWSAKAIVERLADAVDGILSAEARISELYWELPLDDAEQD